MAKKLTWFVSGVGLIVILMLCFIFPASRKQNVTMTGEEESAVVKEENVYQSLLDSSPTDKNESEFKERSEYNRDEEKFKVFDTMEEFQAELESLAPEEEAKIEAEIEVLNQKTKKHPSVKQMKEMIRKGVVIY